MNKNLELLFEMSDLFISNGEVVKNTLGYNIKNFRDSDVYKYPLAVDVVDNQIYVYCHKQVLKKNLRKILEDLRKDPNLIVIGAISTKY